MRRGCSWCAAARSRRSRTVACATCPTCSRPGDALVFNDTRVIPARLAGLRARGEATARVEVTAPPARAARTAGAPSPGRPSASRSGDRIRFGEASESMACLLGQPRRGGAGERRGRRGPAALRPSPAPASTRRSPRSATCRCRPTSPRRRAADDARPGRLPDRLRPRARARSRRRPPACTSPTSCSRGSTRAASRATSSRCMSAPAPSCRSRPRTPPTTACTPNGARSTRRPPRRSTPRAARGGRIVAVGTTVAAAAGERRAPRTARFAPFARRDRLIFITPGYRFRAVDVLMTNFHLPRSTLFMLVCGLRRARDDAGRLRPRDRRGLPLLLLRRRVPAVSVKRPTH